MRLTQILCAQHLGFMTKRHWIIQTKRVVRETGARAAIEAQGIPIHDAMDVACPPIVPIKLPKVIGYLPETPKMDKTHPFWHNQKSFMYGNSNVLLEGVQQAQVLTKTININRLPDQLMDAIDKTKLSDDSDQTIRNFIYNSMVFDAEQVKLPKKKHPTRLAFNLPRDYGISQSRQFRLLMNKFLFECEKLAGRSITSQRKIIDDAFFVVPFERDGNQIQMEINADFFITAKKPLVFRNQNDLNDDVSNAEIPNLYPIDYTISMPQHNIYHQRNLYPLMTGSLYAHPHTIILNYSPEDVRNLYETEVTPTQFKSRSLLKAFTVAASRARSQFGENVKDLPEPITVQCIQTDGHTYHFGVYQLNTLDLNGTTGQKNYWYNLSETLPLYMECGYRNAQPILDGYNNEVFRLFYAFYKNS